MVEAGKLAPRLDPRRFTLDQIDEAFAALSGPTDGKLVVEL
jgi:NADPH2:quinone reductase